jgi:hypothetical protein
MQAGQDSDGEVGLGVLEGMCTMHAVTGASYACVERKTAQSETIVWFNTEIGRPDSCSVSNGGRRSIERG